MPADAGVRCAGGTFGDGALSCPTVGNCAAIGEYRDSAENEQGFLLSESAGVWRTGVEASLPANVVLPAEHQHSTALLSLCGKLHGRGQLR